MARSGSFPGSDGRSPASTRFESVAVASRWGAHVTPQAGVDLFGRYWTSTSRSSLKSRAITESPVASVARVSTNGDTEHISISAGRARLLDPRSPSTAVDDPFAASVMGLVVGRIALDHLDEVVGYGSLGRDIPTPWSLGGRVILSVADDEVLEADDDGVTHATGRWATERPLPPIRRRSRVAPVELDDAPDEARRLADDAWHDDAPIRCSIGVSTAVGPVAVPATWDHDHGSAVVRRDILARLSPIVDLGACITLDRNADRRADEKVGLILRGTPTLRALPKSHPSADGHVGLVVVPERVTWWFGFASGTAASTDRAAA